jgi:hypothetical protein
MAREAIRAGIWGTALTALVAVLIVVGSRNLAHFVGMLRNLVARRAP